MNIYVANLNHAVRENELQELFAEFGEVSSVKVIKDNMTGKSRGFAFVEMPVEEEANEAINSLHETEFRERTLVVNKARPKTEGGSNGGGNRRGGSYGGGNSYGDRNNNRNGGGFNRRF